MSLNKPLNREENSNLQITVIAKDTINPIQSSTATISITVGDINDNTPQFESYNTSYTIKEDALINTSIATFTATDADLGEFAHIFYTFDVVNDDSKLQIDRDTVSMGLTVLNNSVFS